MSQKETTLADIERLINNRGYEQAESTLKEMLETDKLNIELWDLMAYCYGRKGDNSRAVIASSQALAIEPNNTASLVFRSRHSLLTNDYETSYADAAKVVELSLSSNDHYYLSHARLLMAEALLRLKRYEEALKVCKDISPESAWWCGNGPRTRLDVIADCENALGRG